MQLVNYIGKKVYITLDNGYYYTGMVLSADDESISIRDKKGFLVSLSKIAIATIREVE